MMRQEEGKGLFCSNILDIAYLEELQLQVEPYSRGYILKTYDIGSPYSEHWWLLDSNYNFRSVMWSGEDEDLPHSGIQYDIPWLTKPYQNLFDRATPEFIAGDDWSSDLYDNEIIDWKGKHKKPFQFVPKLYDCQKHGDRNCWDIVSPGSVMVWNDDTIRKYFMKMLETLV